MLAGGGVKGLAGLGAAHALRAHLRDLDTVVGTSIGAVVGAVVALGLDPASVMAHASRRAYRPSLDVVGGLLTRYGLDSGEGLERWLGAALGARAAAMTLGEVPGVRGVSLVVVGTDLHTREAVYMGPSTHPDLPLLRALRISCTIPLLYAAVPLGERLLVDGALTDNFALDWALERFARREVLGVAYRTPPDHRVETFDEFVGAVVGCCVSRRVRDSRSPPVLLLDVGRERATNFGIAPERQRALFSSGVRQARSFLKKVV